MNYNDGVLNFASWNIQGKSLEQLDTWYSEVGDYFDFFSLQEVGQLSKHKITKEFGNDVYEYLLHETEELRNYTAIGSASTSSHLGQMILLQKECVEHVISAWRGDRFIAVELVLAGTGHRVIVASCHLPHSHNDDELFLDALRDLVQLFIQKRDTPIILLGDFNCEQGSERGITSDSCFTLRGCRFFRTNSATRFGKHSETELDYLCCNQAFQQLLLPDEGAAKIQSHPTTRLELGSDHCCISFMAALHDPRATVISSRRRRQYRSSRCKRWQVDPDKLREILPTIAHDFTGTDLQGQWQVLKRVAEQVSTPRTSMKYQDSTILKNLCLRRRLATDPLEKAELTRQVVSLRHLEKSAWIQNLHSRSRQGDCNAIRYLKQRLRPPKGNIHEFVQKKGSISNAATALKLHHEQLFSPDIPEQHQRAIAAAMQTFQERAAVAPSPDFSEEEVQSALDRLQQDKTSGPSGISNELLIQLWDLPDGRPLLCHHLNGLLRADSLPHGLCQAQVALIPKIANITGPKDYRPINLIDCIHKVFSWLLVSRLQPHWTMPEIQMGGMKGTQVCDALMAAQARVTKDSKQHDYNIYLSCDIQTAFDSLDQSTVADFLLAESAENMGHESLQMLRLLVLPELRFYWQGYSWDVQQKAGVQQGGSHSAILFSYVIGLALQKLEREWKQQGELTKHASFCILFMDDLLVSFRDWGQAARLTAQLQDVLQRLGLRLNHAKTAFMSHQDVLDQGYDYPFPSGCLLPTITWATSCTYLRKPLTHFKLGAQSTGDGYADTTMVLLQSMGKATHMAFESLHQCLRKGHWGCIPITVQLCHQFIGGTWFWHSPLMEPLQKYSDKVKSIHATFMVLLLGLFIPSACSSALAHFLNRLRRRVALVVLNHFPTKQWTYVWCKRKWTYLGHVLRMPQSAVARRDMVELAHIKQLHPGPFHHLLQWGCSMLGKESEELFSLAANREAWNSSFVQFSDTSLHHHPIVHESCVPHWRDIFRLEVPWRLGVYLQIQQHKVIISWLDAVHGVQVFERQGTLMEVCKLWLCWLQFEFTGVLLDVYLTADHVLAYYEQLCAIHQHAYARFSVIVLFNQVSERVARKLEGLS